MAKLKCVSTVLAAIVTLTICGLAQAASNQVRIIPASELKYWWQADPSYPGSFPKYAPVTSDLDGCVAVAFEIRSDGTVSNERIWHPSSVPIWALWSTTHNALQAARKWRFAPAPSNPSRDAVYTYVIVTYHLAANFSAAEKDEFKHDKARLNCKIPDFPQQVQAMIRANAKAKATGGKS